MNNKSNQSPPGSPSDQVQPLGPSAPEGGQSASQSSHPLPSPSDQAVNQGVPPVNPSQGANQSPVQPNQQQMPPVQPSFNSLPPQPQLGTSPPKKKTGLLGIWLGVLGGLIIGLIIGGGLVYGLSSLRKNNNQHIVLGSWSAKMGADCGIKAQIDYNNQDLIKVMSVLDPEYEAPTYDQFQKELNSAIEEARDSLLAFMPFGPDTEKAFEEYIDLIEDNTDLLYDLEATAGVGICHWEEAGDSVLGLSISIQSPFITREFLDVAFSLAQTAVCSEDQTMSDSLNNAIADYFDFPAVLLFEGDTLTLVVGLGPSDDNIDQDELEEQFRNAGVKIEEIDAQCPTVDKQKVGQTPGQYSLRD